MGGFLSGRTSLTTVQTADIANDAITLAKLAAGTDGNIISFDASGDPVAIVTGNDGQVLHSAGAGAQPAFETLSAGKILQVVHTTFGDFASGTTVTPMDDTIPQITEGDEYMTQAITPTASDSTLHVIVVCDIGLTYNAVIAVHLHRDTTANAVVVQVADLRSATSGKSTCTIHWQESAASTSSTTFKVRAGTQGGGTLHFNASGAGSDFGGNCGSSMSILEIGA